MIIIIKVKFKENIQIGKYLIKKGTIGRILNKNNGDVTPDCCLSESIFVSRYDILKLNNKTISTNKKYLVDGLSISTKTKNILIEANSWYQEEYEIYDWQIKNILGFIPETFKPEHNRCFGEYKLWWVIEYLNDELREWVEQNGKFETVTEKMQKWDYYSDYEVGDKILVNYDEFIKERDKLNKKLECIGFYYNFDGGLILHEYE